MGAGEAARADDARRSTRQFVVFLLVGGLNTAVGYGLFAAFLFLGLHYGIAALLSTILGVLFNFQTIGRLVFGSRDPSLVLRFVAVYAFTYVLNVGALRAFHQPDRARVLALQAALALPVALVAFVLHRTFVFRREVGAS